MCESAASQAVSLDQQSRYWEYRLIDRKLRGESSREILAEIAGPGVTPIVVKPDRIFSFDWRQTISSHPHSASNRICTNKSRDEMHDEDWVRRHDQPNIGAGPGYVSVDSFDSTQGLRRCARLVRCGLRGSPGVSMENLFDGRHPG